MVENHPFEEFHPALAGRGRRPRSSSEIETQEAVREMLKSEAPTASAASPLRPRRRRCPIAPTPRDPSAKGIGRGLLTGALVGLAIYVGIRLANSNGKQREPMGST